MSMAGGNHASGAHDEALRGIGPHTTRSTRRAPDEQGDERVQDRPCRRTTSTGVEDSGRRMSASHETQRPRC